jgi:hypothetical protein
MSLFAIDHCSGGAAGMLRCPIVFARPSALLRAPVASLTTARLPAFQAVIH